VFNFTKKNLIILAITCVLLVVVASSIPSIRSSFVNTLKHPLSLFTFFGREFGGIIFYHRNLVQSEQLRKEVGLLKNKLNSSRELYKENLRLKEILSLRQKSPFKVIAARVIARSPESWSSTVIIDKGKHQGLRRGMAVITYLGLAGRLVETDESTSKIMLINDPSLGVSGIVQRSRQEGLVCGTLGNNLIMRYLPEESDIKVRDIVVTSGLSQIYPKGILIGTVVDIGKEFSGLSSYALIRPAVNLANIEEVLVVVP